MGSVNSDKQLELNKLLLKLAKSQLTLQNPKEKSNIYKKLEEIYFTEDKNNEFRHYYSEIFAILSQVDSDPELGDLDTLAQNLAEIKNGYRPMNKKNEYCSEFIDIHQNINKLFDHVNLDIARIQYMKKIERQTMEAKEKLSHVLDSAESLKQNVESMQKEYISILGIFSSIVLAFIGGISFSASVLENIAKASIYRTLGVVLILGFILINVINILLQFILKINRKETKTEKNNHYMAYINIALGICFTLVVIAWIFDLHSIVKIIRCRFINNLIIG